MRFTLLPLLALLPLSLALGETSSNLVGRDDTAALSNDTAFAAEMQVAGGRWGHHKPGKKCWDNPLRNPYDHCHCKPGLDDINGSCCCGDTANTMLTLQGCSSGGGGCNNPVCVCEDKKAKYDVEKKKCYCPPGTTPSYDHNGKLKCKKGPKPSKKPHHPKRDIDGAIADHRDAADAAAEQEITLESIMSCRAGEKACKVGPAFVCTDVSSNLASCGACPGEADDCSSLPGVDQVRCEQGRCVIDTCQRGFALEQTATPVNSTLPAFACKPKGGSSWLHFQRPL